MDVRAWRSELRQCRLKSSYGQLVPRMFLGLLWCPGHAKSMKFKDGYMISSGQPVKEYIDLAVRHVLLQQGVLGIKVKIMLDWDPKGKQGPTTPLPDLVTIHPPKDEEEYAKPSLALAPEIPVA
ncbi:hypothetical protein ZIOFF_038284 [Zingiber officinale]|uniref:Small ribosomal subunit protein uS3 C-terminal domain-containing protein n=1 Tax=Zingiber officinale TaxID=94328 RepID=A0A8J5KW90_ZINOF|nr:hypothetical protein ZIOFF_038284 [Zingiber officinale]